MNWFEEYKNSLKMAEVEEVSDLIFYRPLAFLLVKLVYRTEIKPDHLTVAAVILGLFGGYFYSLGLPESCIIGALCYMLFNILDCSDGQLARLKKNGTSAGRLLDGIADYIAAIAIYSGIVIGYSKSAEKPSLMIILLLLTGISTIIQEILVDYYRTRFLDIVLKRKNTFDEGIEVFKNEYKSIKNQKGKWFEKSIILIYLTYSELQRKIVVRNRKEKSIKVAPLIYFNLNRLIIRFWVFMGPSAKISALIICSFFCRFDIFIWIVLGGFNILALSLWVIQRKIDVSLETQLK